MNGLHEQGGDGCVAKREREALDRLKAELAQAYSAPESAYKSLTAADVIKRNRP